MKLPNIPLPTMDVTGAWIFTDQQVGDYGKECAAAALDDVIGICQTERTKGYDANDGAWLTCAALICARVSVIQESL